MSVDHVPCPHCEDGHGSPSRTPWGVYVSPERDGDGQPVRLYVQPTAGAHVADDDALWLWRLIRERGPVADRPLNLGPDGLPRLNVWKPISSVVFAPQLRSRRGEGS